MQSCNGHLSASLQAGVKAKKATETYKSYVEKYATAKSEFEHKMAETAQVSSAWSASLSPACMRFNEICALNLCSLSVSAVCDA